MPDRPLVVLAGNIHPEGRAVLDREARVIVCDEEAEGPFVKAASAADGILFRVRPRCTESLMAACARLRVVGRHGVGLDTVDIPAATKLGVAVVHAPGSNAQSVAEHALMLMLVCAKRTLTVDRETRKADWNARGGGNVELAGKTVGIVGVGNIGRTVAAFTAALGMRVLGYDKYVPAEELRRRGVEPVASLEALVPHVDFLTCHTPLTDETRGLDVFEEEPSSADNPLFNLDNVVVSAHVAGVTGEATARASVQVATEMLRVLRGERPDVLVNPDVWPRLGQRA
jgi:phosphoglycerate dehydrogenase-like enzyme